MKHEQIEARFRSIFALGIRSGTKGEQRAAAGAALRMVKRYPWLRDVARQMGFKMPGPHTQDLPFKEAKPAGKQPPRPTEPALSKSRSRAARAKEWQKPPAPRGYKYQQCHKANCRCMKGGPWHGPYCYHSERDGNRVHSKYVGKYNS